MIFHTEWVGADHDALTAALAEALKLASETRQAAIATDKTADFAKNGPITHVLGPEAYAAFATDCKAVINGVCVYWITKRDDAPEFVSGPVIALHLSSCQLESVRSNPRATYVIYVPWSEEELESFKQAHPNAAAIPVPGRTQEPTAVGFYPDDSR